jgi:hypothetical protein
MEDNLKSLLIVPEENIMPSSRLMFLNFGYSIDHLFMIIFPALAATDLSEN